MKTSILQALFIAVLATVVQAHPEEEDVYLEPTEIARRQAAATARHIQARSCASAINTFHAKRKAERRSLNVERAEAATSTLSAAPPHYTVLQNTTCVTAPEVTEGPYYVRNELVRQDLRETQAGVSLVLDIGVMDTKTCTPLSNAFVELWAANATGHYGGFTTLNGGGGGPGGGNAETDNFSWLRGGYTTNANGIVELTTIYPGFYAGRTIHIHTAVITNWTESANGTIQSGAGQLRHIGQLFFDEALNTQVIATSAYQSNTQQHTLNSADGILAQENSHGYNAFVDTELLGSTVDQGLLGYITIGVDTSAQYQFTTTNYWHGST